MSRAEHFLGLTPVFKRLAYYYLKKGLGSHPVEPPLDALFDEIWVKDLYEWHTPDDKAVPPQGGLVVEFWWMGKKVKWAEFGCRFIGGGGPPIMGTMYLTNPTEKRDPLDG